MRIEIADNSSRKLLPILTKAINGSTHSRFAVAFVSKGGLDLIRSAIETCLSNGGDVEFLIGLDMTVSEPEAVWEIYRICGKSRSVAMYCYANLERSTVYHPKLYLMNSEEEATAVAGSSNLTQGGLKKNVEINTVIHASTREEIVSDIFDAYNKLKFHPQRVEPDEEFLFLYEQFCRTQNSISRKVDTRSIKREFDRKMATLRHPIPTTKDLLGWQRLIYSKLPTGHFSNEDIYAYEEEFRQYYPENRNIRAKIRQKLQELREMSLIRHVGRAHWNKS